MAMPYCSCSDSAFLPAFASSGSAARQFSPVRSQNASRFELVRAGARNRNDRGAAELVELRLVVGGDDLVLADGQLRERIAARQGLTADATAQHVVLLADAIDEHVHAVGCLRAAAKFAVEPSPFVTNCTPGDDVREGEEVARILRQELRSASARRRWRLRRCWFRTAGLR